MLTWHAEWPDLNSTPTGSLDPPLWLVCSVRERGRRIIHDQEGDL